MGLSQFLRLRGKQVRTQRGTIRQLTSSDRDPQLWNLCQSVSTSYNAHGMFEWLSHTFNTVVTLEIRLWVMSQSRFDWGIAFHGYGISTVDLCELHSGWQSNDKASGVTTQPRFPCLWCMTGLHQGFHGCQNSMVTIKLVWEWHQKKKCMRVASEEEMYESGIRRRNTQVRLLHQKWNTFFMKWRSWWINPEATNVICIYIWSTHSWCF